MKRNNALPIGGLVLFLLTLLACACLVGALLARKGLTSYLEARQPCVSEGLPCPTDMPDPKTPLSQTPDLPAGNDLVSQPSISNLQLDQAQQTLRLLEQVEVPVNDPFDLAGRLKGQRDIPRTRNGPARVYQPGDQQVFWALNTDTKKNFQIQALLRYVTPHLYFWVEEGVNYDQTALEELAETFEAQIYTRNRAFFGSEWTPGVDGDQHLYILLADNLGKDVAGYFSTSDEFPPQIKPYSNTHEMFLLNARSLRLEQSFTYSVLAHEFQHMIHWFIDPNEEIWVNEGLSNLAILLNDYTIGGSDYAYSRKTDIQLTDWPDQSGARTPHYGGAFLFMAYLLDRMGDQTTQAIIAHPVNGLAAIDLVLSEQKAWDTLIKAPIKADDLFADWVVANYLQDPLVSDGRYIYRNYPGAPQADPTETIQLCPNGPLIRQVSQYGVDYIRVNCRGTSTLVFKGNPLVNLLPVTAHSGQYAFWSNRGELSNMTLTRSFDFRNLSGPITLDYWTWYDLEAGYDYLYLAASFDGENWEILTTPSGTANDPSGNSYGWAYTGMSGGGSTPVWIKEQVDLSRFAGQQVRLRFEYVTDTMDNGEGLLLDDISVPQVGYFNDFESDEGGWEAGGFVRVQNALPQKYRLAIISHGQTTSVEYYQLNGENQLSIPLQIGDEVDYYTLAVSGVTRFTRQKANYQIQMLR